MGEAEGEGGVGVGVLSCGVQEKKICLSSGEMGDVEDCIGCRKVVLRCSRGVKLKAIPCVSYVEMR